MVTGAGTAGQGVGTGKAISILFAREGARVLLVDREIQRAEETLAIIQEEGGQASVFGADVTKADDCRRMADAAVERYNQLDILCNNVGGNLAPGTAIDISEEDWDRVINVNLKSGMLASKYAIPIMIKGGGGAIVNIASIAAWISDHGAVLPYAVAKSGIVSLTISMAVAHGKDNIRVNCVAPGTIVTPGANPGQVMTEEMLELRRVTTPLGTEGTAWDVAWAVLFLASDEARWITGVALPVDGGRLTTRALYKMDPSMLHHLR